VGERFLTVAVLAEFHGHHTCRGVGMVRRTDDHCIDFVVHLVEHFSKVLISFGFGVSLECLGRMFFIDVTQCDYIFACHTINVRSAATADPDSCNVQLIVGLSTAY
jgi:hypothetical protein